MITRNYRLSKDVVMVLHLCPSLNPKSQSLSFRNILGIYVGDIMSGIWFKKVQARGQWVMT